MQVSSQRGFTLLELVVVLSILTLLAGLVAPYMAVTMRLEATEQTQTSMDRLEEALTQYGADLLTLPSDLDQLMANGDALPGWRGPYAVHRFAATGTAASGDVRDDGWSQRFVYTRDSVTIARLRSLGDDRTAGTADDLVKDLDLTPVLRRETGRREESLNAAITRYNADFLPGTPLSTDFATLRQRLIDAGYTGDVSWHATDAWGAPFIVEGSPPTRVRSGS